MAQRAADAPQSKELFMAFRRVAVEASTSGRTPLPPNSSRPYKRSDDTDGRVPVKGHQLGLRYRSVNVADGRPIGRGKLAVNLSSIVLYI